MSLEQELQDMLKASVTADPLLVEGMVYGEREVSQVELVEFLSRMATIQNRMIIRIAQEVDKLTA